MGELALDRSDSTFVERILKDELARENRALSGVAPVVSHLLQSPGQTLVSDAVVARMRGMLGDLAWQWLSAVSGEHAPFANDADQIDGIAEILAAEPLVLNHLHALALEGIISDRLEKRHSIDPVLSPLLQELIASDQPEIAELAMNTLAAQSRFLQSQRRMGLPLGELPSDVFLIVVQRFRNCSLGYDEAAIKQTGKALKRAYDEGAGRIGLLARLVSSMRGGAVAALELEHAGIALFASALAVLTRQQRDLAVLACHEQQAGRLALSLRGAGLNGTSIKRQFLFLEPSDVLPEGVGEIAMERALELLADPGAGQGS
jgi:hypothetical protein